MHPYMVYMIAILLSFSVWVAVRDGRITWSVRGVIRFANPILICAGAVLFLVVGQLTWMRRVLHFDYDPLAMLGNSWTYAIDRAVVEHFADPTTSWMWIAGLALLTLIGLAVVRFHCSRDILPPLVLVFVGFFSTAIVSALSAMRTYWILERQWVAGIAIVTVGSVWFFAEMLRSSRVSRSRALALPAYIFVAVTLVSAGFTSVGQARVMNDKREAYAQFRDETRIKDELRPAQVNDDTGYTYAANVNIARGGPVWTMFIDWYNNLSGMRPEFREKNPSWTGFLGD